MFAVFFCGYVNKSIGPLLTLVVCPFGFLAYQAGYERDTLSVTLNGTQRGEDGDYEYI
jgi:hypothetical protein